jgi:hypothetical protein
MTNTYPRLRSHVRRGKNGKTRTYYFYDMRHEGKPDVPLGRDYDEALKQWDQIHNRKPRILGTLEEAFERFEREVIPTLSAGNAKNYRAHLKVIRGPMGRATWASIDQPALWAYYDSRSNKGQAKKEIRALSFIWNKALRWGLTRLPNPARGMQMEGYAPRRFEVSDALFAAVYSCADSVLRDTMDLATATGMRLTDARRVLMPSGGSLRLTASKTGKLAEFDVSSSPVLTRMVEHRRSIKADHLMLLTTPTGKPVSATMLRARWDEAREKAAKAHPELAAQIEAMYLRDMRKRAADLASDLEEASRLLQHSSTKVTADHYRNKPVKVRPVR